MGCGTSQHTYQPEQGGYKGHVIINIQSAFLERDVAWLGNMSPYVTLNMNGQKYTSEVGNPSGKYPKWQNAQTTFRKNIGQPDVIKGQVWSKNTISSDVLIGEGAFSLTSVRKGTATPVEIKFNLYEKGQKAGIVTVDVVFSLDPSGNSIPEIMAPDTTGVLRVEPKQASLVRDLNLITKMDPFLTIRFGNESMSSSVVQGGGKTPSWVDTLSFQREVDEDILYIEAWNFSDFGSNDLIGTGYLSITEALNLEEKQMQKVQLMFENYPAGEVTLCYTFQTNEPQKYMNDNNQQQAQQPSSNPNQVVPQQHLPQQLQSFVCNAGQRQNQVFDTQEQQLRYPNGDVYQGEFQNNMRHGRGKMIYQYGGYYEGLFSNDLFNGQGVLQVGDTMYTGEFLNGKKNGRGKQEWNNKQSYDGFWVNNNMDGEGEWTFPNGAKKRGVWSNGNRLRWLDDQQNTLQSGRTISQGGMIHSPSGRFTLTLAYDGKLFIYDNTSRLPVFRGDFFNRAIRPPFWLRLEQDGELCLIDGTGFPYWTSGKGNPMFLPPFVCVLEDSGRLIIYDANRQPKWFSH